VRIERHRILLAVDVDRLPNRCGKVALAEAERRPVVGGDRLEDVLADRERNAISISPSCALLKSSIIFFMRTPSPPPRKSHQITVSLALAAAPSAMTVVAASAALIMPFMVPSPPFLGVSVTYARTPMDRLSRVLARPV
jgi:hypothetical protein